MNELETVRYVGCTWYVCPVRGCTCLMSETPAMARQHNPDAPTHACADWDCWGLAWIVDGRIERVRREPPHENARARKALRAVEGD